MTLFRDRDDRGHFHLGHGSLFLLAEQDGCGSIIGTLEIDTRTNMGNAPSEVILPPSPVKASRRVSPTKRSNAKKLSLSDLTADTSGEFSGIPSELIIPSPTKSNRTSPRKKSQSRKLSVTLSDELEGLPPVPPELMVPVSPTKTKRSSPKKKRMSKKLSLSELAEISADISVEGTESVFVLKRLKSGAGGAGMFWHPDPTGRAELSVCGHWPREGAMLRGTKIDVKGQKWLMCTHLRQSGGEWTKAPKGAALPFGIDTNFAIEHCRL